MLTPVVSPEVRAALDASERRRRPRIDDLLQPRTPLTGERRGPRPLCRGGAWRRRGPGGHRRARRRGHVSGSTPTEHDRILGAARKAAERDLAVAVAQRWEFGATTVSASLALAAAAGVSVFATGGIGGVHRGAEVTGDVSADLDALARTP